MNVKLHVVAIALIVTAIFVFECDTKKENYWNCRQFNGHHKNVCRYRRAVYKDLIEAKQVVCDDFEKLAFLRCTNATTIEHRESMYICVRSEYARLCKMTEMQEEAACIKENCTGQFDDTESSYNYSCPLSCVQQLEFSCARRKCNVNFPEIKQKNYWNCHPFEGHQKEVCRYGQAVYKDLLEERQICSEVFEARAFEDCTTGIKNHTKKSMDECVRFHCGYYRRSIPCSKWTACKEDSCIKENCTGQFDDTE